MLLLNFTHPLTSEQLEQVEAMLGEPLAEVRQLRLQFDHDASFVSQVKELVDGLGLSPQAWQTRPILVNPPAHSPITAILLAELHGRMGYFPAIIRLKPAEKAATQTYVVAEIINLQAVRDRARSQRSGPAADAQVTTAPSRSPAPEFSLPPAFSLARYQFAVAAAEPLKLPPFKGSVLRGGFGEIFKAAVCEREPRCGQQCRRGNECPYGYIFETSPPENSQKLSRQREVPRPFVIQAPEDRRTEIPPGEWLTFGLTLVGHGFNYFPHFVLVFQRLGQSGIGQNRDRFHLLGVDMVDPFEGTREAVYRLEDEIMRVPQAMISGDMITAYARTLPPDRVTLDFVTPTRLVQRGKIINRPPSFLLLFKTLLRRLKLLGYFHCGVTFDDTAVGTLLDRAGEIERADDRTRWIERFRRSSRQRQHIPISGLVGQVTYRGDLRPFLPLLVAGELVHIGKGTVFGNGQYRILDR